MNNRTTVLYVAGTGRSGSTALAQYLSGVDNFFHAGELRYLWTRGVEEDQLCECRSRFSECPFWQDVLSEAYGARLLEIRQEITGRADRIDRMRYIPGSWLPGRLSVPSRRPEFSELLVPLYKAIQRASGAEVVVDSSKDSSYLYALGGSHQLDLRVLHLIRDSRAVANSWTRKKVRPEIHWETQFMKTLPPRRSASLWMAHHLALEAHRIRFGQSTRLRYEDFAAAPHAALAEALPRLGLSLPAEVKPSRGHSFSGNPMRFSDEPFSVSLDERWRSELSARDLRTITRITYPLLKVYGYI